jgi:O-antigen/teichoic acid export membrane protein
VYTRFLTTADYGVMGYALVVNQIMAAIFMFGIRGAQTRFYYQYQSDRQDLGSFMFSINCFLWGTLVWIFTGLSLVGALFFKQALLDTVAVYPFWHYILWTCFFQILNQMVVSFYLAAKEYRICALLQIAQFLMITCGVVYFVVFAGQGALGQIKGLFWGHVVFFLVFYQQYARKFSIKFSFTHVHTALIFGIPIAFHLLGGIIHGSIDRLILERFVSFEQLGIYTLGYQIGMVMGIVVDAVNKAWQPNYFELMNTPAPASEGPDQKAREIRRMIALWITVMGLTCLVGIFFNERALIFLTPESFHAVSRIIPVILFAYLFQGLYFLFVSPLFQFKKTKLLPFLTGGAAIVNIGLNFLLIPWFGIQGAAVATLCSLCCQAIVVYQAGKKLFDIHLETGRLALLVCYVGAAVIVNATLPLSFKSEMIKLILILAYGGLSVGLFSSYLPRRFIRK